MNVDGLFLDLYGTLTDGDRDAVEDVCQDIVRDYRLTMTAKELAAVWGERFLCFLNSCEGSSFLKLYELEMLTLKETMTQLDRRVEPLAYVEKLRQYWQAPPLQPEARRFLAEIQHPVCLVTNADRADVDAMMRHCNLRVFHVVTSEEACCYKPNRGIFEMALEQTGWDRDRVIHVGDSLHSDVGGAKAAGIRSGWVNRARRIYDSGNHRPDYEFTDLVGLLELLERPDSHRIQ